MSKLNRIKNYWLDLAPEEDFDFSEYKYLIYDGTYFHRKGCFICLMGATDQQIISHIYTKKEGCSDTFSWMSALKEKGLNPHYITMDGEQSVIRAINEIWPQMKIQRCLYHIQREGMRWLRTKPKIQAGRDLRCLLKTLCRINSFDGRDKFITSYKKWIDQHKVFVMSLPKKNISFKDLKKAMTLITNASPNMFHFLTDKNIPKTTNTLESFFSRLKADYKQHRGITEESKIKYLKWYCYIKNKEKTNTL